MTTPRSRENREDHGPRRSAVIQEPPTDASLPSSDDAVDYNQRSTGEWGKTLGKKQGLTLRIAFQNIGGFLKDDEMEMKFEAVRRFVTEHSIDIFGFTESNTCWDVLDEPLRPATHTRGWWESCQWVVSHNRTEEHLQQYQPGGTGLLCVNQVAHRALCPGDDTLGLGRWCWTRLRGPNGFFVRIVSLYRPCYASGPLSTYQQQIRTLAKKNRYECPRDAVLADLSAEMQLWQEMGDHLIVLTDFNDDVTAADARNWAAALGLVEALMHLNSGPAPPTYQRGSRPIDGIFIAPQLLPFAAGGYLAFGDAVPSDHRALWIDLHLPELCPQRSDVHIKPTARRLQCRDPRIVARYNDLLLEILTLHNVPQRLSLLTAQLHKPSDLRQVHRKELNSIDHIVTAARLTAEKSCRKLKCGQVQWSPPVTKLIYKILFWKGLLKREQGGKVSLPVLRSRAKKAQIPHVPYPGEVSQQVIQEKISAAYKSFARFKKDDNSRDTWIAQLIEAQASAWNKTKKRSGNSYGRRKESEKRLGTSGELSRRWCAIDPWRWSPHQIIMVTESNSTRKRRWNRHALRRQDEGSHRPNTLHS